jgi:hypothetical protein
MTFTEWQCHLYLHAAMAQYRRTLGRTLQPELDAALTHYRSYVIRVCEPGWFARQMEETTRDQQPE